MKKNYLKENDVPQYVRDRNQKMEHAFETIKIVIQKIQGFIEDESLRVVIVSDYRKSPDTIATINQITTRFCIISIGADDMGRYNIAVSLDKEINERISMQASITLLRRLFELTSGSLETFVRMHSYNQDCDHTFSNIINEIKNGNSNHVLVVNPKYS